MLTLAIALLIVSAVVLIAMTVLAVRQGTRAMRSEERRLADSREPKTEVGYVSYVIGLFTGRFGERRKP